MTEYVEVYNNFNKIISKNFQMDLNDKRTKRNGNCLVIGGSGAG